MKNCEIILAGFGGQGILFAGKVLSFAAMLCGRELSWLPSYGPEMRGGTANCHVKIDSRGIGSPIVTNPDILIAMNRPSLDKFEDTVRSGGYIFMDSSLVNKHPSRNDINIVYVNATQTADKMGIKNLANMVMIGKLIKETGLFELEEITNTIKKLLPAKKEALTLPNIQAVTAGYSI